MAKKQHVLTPDEARAFMAERAEGLAKALETGVQAAETRREERGGTAFVFTAGDEKPSRKAHGSGRKETEAERKIRLLATDYAKVGKPILEQALKSGNGKTFTLPFPEVGKPLLRALASSAAVKIAGRMFTGDDGVLRLRVYPVKARKITDSGLSPACRAWVASNAPEIA